MRTMLLCALVTQIHAQTPKTGEKKAGLPGVTPAAKAMSPDAIQLGKLRVVLYDLYALLRLQTRD